MNKKLGLMVGAALLTMASQAAMAACSDISRDQLQSAANLATEVNTGGYGLPMWVTMVDETGKVCHVVNTGATGALAGNSQWLGSRVISAQKANTANAFSLDGYKISTANLYTPVQPGMSLYGLQHSNPVDASRAYQGDAAYYGTKDDPLKKKRIGGVNVFGGGLGLYNGIAKVGAIGVSGDTSCRDHAFAWEVRKILGMDNGVAGITTANLQPDGDATDPDAVPAAVDFISAGGVKGDEMIFASEGYWSLWAHPLCPNTVKGEWSVDAPNVDIDATE
jgi:uncharacterized protein GlcG (DUF336 family)